MYIWFCQNILILYLLNVCTGTLRSKELRIVSKSKLLNLKMKICAFTFQHMIIKSVIKIYLYRIEIVNENILHVFSDIWTSLCVYLVVLQLLNIEIYAIHVLVYD